MILEDIVRNFNPHSREGSDGNLDVTQVAIFDFNPHSREGSDIRRHDRGIHRSISIHTPAKGVTDGKPIKHLICNDFNPHSREGSDAGSQNANAAFYNFNPHSREGSDRIRSDLRTGI